MKKIRSVRKRSTFRLRDRSKHTESRLQRALRNNRLSGKIAKGSS